jgi:pantothenate synthetase
MKVVYASKNLNLFTIKVKNSKFLIHKICTHHREGHFKSVVRFRQSMILDTHPSFIYLKYKRPQNFIAAQILFIIIETKIIGKD